MKEYRRVPLSQLRRRLKVEQYEAETPFDPAPLNPARVRIKLRQHAGAQAVPVVQPGARIRRGQPVGRVPEGELGAHVHASVTGKVTQVNQAWIEIEAR
jgi:Na+-translocating ferredoxin:NAD+ oxidoreductase RnfC subunit